MAGSKNLEKMILWKNDQLFPAYFAGLLKMSATQLLGTYNASEGNSMNLPHQFNKFFFLLVGSQKTLIAIVGAFAVIAVASGVAAGYTAQSLFAPSVASVRVAPASLLKNLAATAPAAKVVASAQKGIVFFEIFFSNSFTTGVHVNEVFTQPSSTFATTALAALMGMVVGAGAVWLLAKKNQTPVALSTKQMMHEIVYGTGNGASLELLEGKLPGFVADANVAMMAVTGVRKVPCKRQFNEWSARGLIVIGQQLRREYQIEWHDCCSTHLHSTTKTTPWHR